MARYGGMVSVMAIVLLAALFASPAANCRSLGDDEGASASMALMNNSTASSDSVGRPTGAGDLVFCVQRSCVYPNRGSADCYCCSIVKPNKCFDTRGKCNANCL